MKQICNTDSSIYIDNKYQTPNIKDIKRLIFALLEKDVKLSDINCFVSHNDEGLSNEQKNDNYYDELKLKEIIQLFNKKKL
jgi:hypothetical protein